MRGQGWLSRCSPAFQNDLLRRCQLRRLSPGSPVYNVGEKPGGMFGIFTGSLEVRVPPGDSIVSIFGPGTWLGAATALRRAERWVSAHAVGAATVLHLSQRGFEALILDPSHCREIAIGVAEDLGEAVSVVANLTHPDSEIRVAQRLISFSGLYGDDRREVLPVSQANLAKMCGLSRQTMIKVLATLSDRGMIRTAYRRLEIIDLAALRALACDDDRVFE